MNLGREAEKDDWELVLENTPNGEQDVPVEEQKRESESEEEGGDGRCADALKRRSKSVRKDLKRRGEEKANRRNMRSSRLSNIQAEAGPLKDQYQTKSGVAENTDGEGGERKR